MMGRTSSDKRRFRWQNLTTGTVYSVVPPEVIIRITIVSGVSFVCRRKRTADLGKVTVSTFFSTASLSNAICVSYSKIRMSILLSGRA